MGKGGNRASKPYFNPLSTSIKFPHAFANSLRSLGYPKEKICAHGFRAMAATTLSDLGWASEVIERQLAHIESVAAGDDFEPCGYGLPLAGIRTG